MKSIILSLVLGFSAASFAFAGDACCAKTSTATNAKLESAVFTADAKACSSEAKACSAEGKVTNAMAEAKKTGASCSASMGGVENAKMTMSTKADGKSCCAAKATMAKADGAACSAKASLADGAACSAKTSLAEKTEGKAMCPSCKAKVAEKASDKDDATTQG